MKLKKNISRYKKLKYAYYLSYMYVLIKQECFIETYDK